MTQKIDSKNLDVIVIGAGPAGGSTARELAKLGRKVLLIERSQEIGEPNYSTAGTPKETVEEFDLPQEVISATWKRILFTTPRVQAEWKYEGIGGYVFDFAALRKFLAEDAAEHGAEILVGTDVEDFVKEGENIVGVRYHGALGSGEVRAKIIVDATGHNELANSKLRANSMDLETLGSGMEYIMTKVPIDLKETLAFYVGSEYAYHGYSWVFPMSKNHDAKVGTCVLGPLPEGKKLDDMQDKFLKAFSFFKDMEPVEIHAGGARADGGVKNHVYKNVILVGDAAHQVHPMLGEGIRHALSAGRLAANVIDLWLQKSPGHVQELKSLYEKQWQAKFGPVWRLSWLGAKRARNFSDDQWDRFIASIKQLSAGDFMRIFRDYDFKVLFKYPKLAMELVKMKLQGK